jgi:hypothetical protein
MERSSALPTAGPFGGDSRVPWPRGGGDAMRRLAADDAGRPRADDAAPRPRGATRVLPPDDPSLDPRRPVRVARGVSAILVVVCLVGSLQAVAMITIEARRFWTSDREIVRLEREVAELRRETADLIEIAARGDDARFREHLARRQGYVYPDEVRYVIGPRPGPP